MKSELSRWNDDLRKTARAEWRDSYETRRDASLQTAVESLLSAIALFGIVILMWLFVCATPPQKSAECEAAAEELSGAANAPER